MKSLQILLLGTPEIRWEEKRLSISRRIPRILLFYLASKGGMIGRSEIGTLFWEDEDEARVRQNVRDNLNKLRAALPDPDLIVVENDCIGLNFDRVYVDQLAFQALVAQAGQIPWKTPASEPLPAWIYQLLQKAVDLWHGPYFLTGLESSMSSSLYLDDWLTITTQQVEHLHARVLKRLAEHAEAIGEPEEALRLARKAIERDNLDESLHEQVMRLFIRMGHREKARKHYQDVKKLFKQELATQPGAELVRLYSQIQDTTDPDPVIPMLEWNVHPSLNVPFVGRQQVLAQLKRCFLKGGCVVLYGESGVGKTRLLHEFARRLDPQPQIIVNRCKPAEQNLPFQLVIDSARNSLVLLKQWQQFPAVWANYFLPLIPELTRIRKDLKLPVAGDPEQGRMYLFEAIRQWILLAVQQGRLLAIFDDAQWIDEATTAAGSYILQRPPFNDGQALIILTARREEPNPHLEKMIANLQEAGCVTVIDLPRFTLDEISELTRSVWAEPSDQFVEQLANDTGGNPFFILETLRALLNEQPNPNFVTPPRLPMTHSLKELIHARLNRLTPLARDILETAAVIGSEFDPAMVMAASQRSAEELTQALDELEERLLVEPFTHHPNNPCYHFLHEKLREALLEEIGASRTRRLHGQVARALEAAQGSRIALQAGILAQHFEAARDLTKAFEYWVKAGLHSQRLFSLNETIHSFTHAERLIAQIGETLTDRQILDLYDIWGQTIYAVNDTAGLTQLFKNLLQLGQTRQSPLLEGLALNGLSDAEFTVNHFEEGLNYANQALLYLEHGGYPPATMLALDSRGVFLYMLNRWDEALDSFQKALAMGCDLPDPMAVRARAGAHYQIALVKLLTGWPAESRIHATSALSEQIAMNDVHGQVAAYSGLALSGYFLAEYREAQLSSQLGIDLAERIQAWRMLGYLHAYRGMIEQALGNPDAALEHAEQAIALGNQHGHYEITAAGLRLFGDMHLWLRMYAKAAEYYQQALDMSQDQFLFSDHRFRLGLALILTGQVETGQKHVQETLAITREAGLGLVYEFASLVQARIHFINKEWDQAYEIASKIHAEAIQRGIPLYRLLALNTMNEIAQVASDGQKSPEQQTSPENGITEGYPLSLESFQASVRDSARTGYLWLEMDAQILLERAYQKFGIIDPAPRRRIHQLFDLLEPKITREPYRQYFQALKTQVTQKIAEPEFSPWFAKLDS